MAAAYTPFPVDSEGCRLIARSYEPERPAHPGTAVFLLHGFLASADTYDVAGLEDMSLARGLQREGLHVISYDQRGAGDSTAGNWKFGLKEHALIDLPAVVDASAAAFGLERIILMGHSLGGTIWLRYLTARLASATNSAQPRVVGGVVVASPASFDGSFPPWSHFARRGRRFVESIDHDRDDIVSRAEFTVGQALLYWRWATPFLGPKSVEMIIRAGTKSPLAAGIVRWFPLPTLIYDKHDFDNVAFMHVLRSRALHRGSQQLLLEIFDEIGPAAATRPAPIDLDVLCIGSAADRLVPLRSVEGFARSFTSARVVATEQDYGAPSGHAGYFFKDGVWEKVFAQIASYVHARLGN